MDRSTPNYATEVFAQAWALVERPGMARIKAQVAAAHELTVADLEGPAKGRAIAWPRHEAMWRCRQVTRPGGAPRYSLQQIARAFGWRDHSTVLHACRAHERRMGAGREFPSPNGEGRPRSGQGGDCPRAPLSGEAGRGEVRGSPPPGALRAPPSPLGEGNSGLSGGAP